MKSGRQSQCKKCFNKQKREVRAGIYQYQQEEELPEGHKRCNKCNEIKLLAEFSPHKAGKGGLKPQCKNCCNEWGRQHYAENPEPYNIKSAGRKSSNRTAGDLILTVSQWQEILEEWGHHCIYCGKHESQFEGKLVREHVIPDSQGGLFTATNIAPACPQCNGRKGPRTPEQAGMPIYWELYDLTLVDCRLVASRQAEAVTGLSAQASAGQKPAAASRP